jgi:hypothetical protein
MGFNGDPEPVDETGVGIRPRRSSMSNFAAMLYADSIMLSDTSQATFGIIDGFSNADYGLWKVSVKFCIWKESNMLRDFSAIRQAGRRYNCGDEERQA